MFDILDSNLDLGNLGGLSHSRSSNMKKTNKKENPPPVKQSLSLDKSPKSSFENILQIQAGKQSKYFKDNGSNLPLTSYRNHNQTQDHHFQKNSQSQEITSRTHSNVQKQRSSFKYEIQHNDSNIQMHGISQHFGTTQQTIVNASSVGDSFVSSRQMKPPINRKQSMPYVKSFNFGSAVGNTIPQEDLTIPNSSQDNDELKDKSRSNRRRSSIDSRSDVNQDAFPFARTHNFSGEQIMHDTVKENLLLSIHKSESCFLGQNQKKNETIEYFMAKDKLQQKSQNLRHIQAPQKAELPSKIAQKALQSKVIVEQYEKQIQHLRNSYKNQIQHVQQCLDKQISENKSLRQTFMLQATKMVQDQRSRSVRIHEEQISRLKDMFSWQKRRTEEIYRREIQSLKSSFEFASKNNDYYAQKQGPNKQSLQFLEYQLKSKEQTISNKLKTIELREMELQTKENDLINRRKREEDRFRQEEKRLMEMQLQLKKQILENKKSVSHEKQQLAAQLGSLQNGYLKKSEQVEILKRQLQIQRSMLEQEKSQLRRINSQLMSKHKSDLQEMQRQKQRLKQLQLELVKKIRVVEMKAKELSYQGHNQQDLSSIKRQMNWAQEHEVFSKLASQSAQKKLFEAKSMTNIIKTKQRFNALEHNSKSKLNISVKENKKIDLSGYMTRIESQTKNSWQL